MSDYSPLVAALIAFAGLAFKLVQLVRDPYNPANRAACGVLGSLVAAELVSWYPLYHAIGQVTGVPNFARYVMHLFALCAAASVQSFYLQLSDPVTAGRRARWRWLLLAFVATVMGIAFILADFSVEDVEHFADRYASAPYMREYMLGFLAYLAVAVTDILRMSVRYSRQLPPSALRFSQHVLALGALAGLMFVIHKATYILATSWGIDLPWSERPPTRILIFLGIALVTSGLVIPSIAKGINAVRQWPELYRLHRDMAPLWQALYMLDKSVTLNPPSWRPSVRALPVQVYRRVVEILDGIRQHSAYLNPAAREVAAGAATDAGLPPDEVRAVGDAASIAAMIDYVSATPPRDRKPIADSAAVAFLVAEEDNVAAAQRLAAISRAYATSPIVAAQRASSAAAHR